VKLSDFPPEEAMLALARTLARSPSSASKILKQNKYDPLIQNAVSFMLSKNMSPADKLNAVESYFNDAHERIADNLSKKVRRGSVIATYGNTSSILPVLRSLKRMKIKFIVHVIEHAPIMSGKVIASFCAKQNIPVLYCQDAAARQALKLADILLLGAHAITKKGHVITSMGSELMAETAHRFRSKVFVAAPAWVYDRKNIRAWCLGAPV